MKTPLLRNTLLCLLATLTFSITSCGSDEDDDNDDNNACPGTIIASWKVDGTTFSTINAFTVGHGGSSMNIVIVPCIESGPDHTLSFNLIPYPPAVGSYPVTFTSLHGLPWNGDVSGIYTIEDEDSYFTDSLHTGSLVISSVDNAAHTFTGTFHFDAINDAATKTIHITDGQYTANYTD